MAAKKVVKKSLKKTRKLSITKPFTKTEIIGFIAEKLDIEKKKAVAAIDVLGQIINAHLTKKGPKSFVFPGLAKFKVVRKPAVKSRKGINPFTKEPMTIAAKPAHNVIKIRPLKKLKDMVK